MLTACRLAACVLLPACGPPRAAVIAAEGGPPQIDWQDATLLSNEPVGRGTYQMRVQASEDSPPLGYAAGHILGFEMAHPETGEALKGPYTVTRAPDERQFDVIYRVIPDGRKTPFMEKLTPGAAVRFGGKFGTPIADGIKDDVDRVVGIATGAGLGPLVGYAEATLAGNAPPKVELYGGFRDLADVCCTAECDELAARHPDRTVIGVDRSEARLSRSNEVPANALLLRAELGDFWRLLNDSELTVEETYLLYPNPYPKTKMLKQRFQGHASLPSLLQACGRRLTIRASWRTYLEEFRLAASRAGELGIRPDLASKGPYELSSIQDPLTLFERKYAAAGVPVYELVLECE